MLRLGARLQIWALVRQSTLSSAMKRAPVQPRWECLKLRMIIKCYFLAKFIHKSKEMFKLQQQYRYLKNYKKQMNLKCFISVIVLNRTWGALTKMCCIYKECLIQDVVAFLYYNQMNLYQFVKADLMCFRCALELL